ncbi:MAG: class I SAM-dependent methyltransferase [Nocardioides sp.]
MTEIEPDTKDWTWVLDAPCPECGFAADDVAMDDVGATIRANVELWQLVLAGPAPGRRPRPDVWSPTEYACHVRDVHAIFGERLRLMLSEDDPTFANWDQDAAALASRYDLADPVEVAAALAEEALRVAAEYDAAPVAAHDRRGFRSNGSVFTVGSIARYHLHDVVHHAWDVRREVTVASYDRRAEQYRAATPSSGLQVEAALDDLARRLGPGSRVLEVGSGGGRDAVALEQRGLSVRRTDITPAFVSQLREQGHRADVIDPLVDDLADPERPGELYDGVWANACLLHVARADLATVLTRLCAATRPGGWLRFSVKEGSGDGWSTHGSIESPRMFTYWQAAELDALLPETGWQVEATAAADGQRGERWLEYLVRREHE